MIYPALIICFWVVIKILWLIRRKDEPVTPGNLFAYLVLGLYSFFFIYLTNTYIFEAIPMMFPNLGISFPVVLLPIVADFLTELAVARAEDLKKERRNKILMYFYRTLTFSFIAFGVECVFLLGYIFKSL